MITKIFEYTLSAPVQVFFLIMGTAIGAGMITLPLLTQGFSLLSLTMMLSVSCAIMYGAALCWIDLSEHYGPKSHLTTYVRALIPVLEYPTHMAYLTFFWSLLAYYLSTMPSFIEAYFSISALNHPVVYAVFLVIFLELSPVIQGLVNQWAVFMMLFLLAMILLITCTGSLNFNMPITTGSAPSLTILSPLMMFFGYHLSIPSFRAYALSRDALRQVCLKAGIAIALLYWVWCLILLSAMSAHHIVLDESQFLNQLAMIAQNSEILHPIAWFSLLAMWTSCMGMSLGTQHYLKDLIPKFQHIPLSLSLLNILPSLLGVLFTQGAYRKLLLMASFLALYLLVFLPALLLMIQYRRQGKRHGVAGLLLTLSSALMLAVII